MFYSKREFFNRCTAVLRLIVELRIWNESANVTRDLRPHLLITSRLVIKIFQDFAADALVDKLKIMTVSLAIMQD